MKKQTLIFFIAALCMVCSVAQENPQKSDVNSIENQLAETIDKSNSYQEFKVIKKTKLARLRTNILDTISGLEGTIKTLHTEIDTQKSEIASLSKNLSTVNDNLTASIAKEDGIEIFGTMTKKSTYNTAMWSIIGLLLFALGFFIVKFKNSNSVTRAAKLKLAETEAEFETHRQKKLEEQQQLRRKLQDEINKNRKV